MKIHSFTVLILVAVFLVIGKPFIHGQMDKGTSLDSLDKSLLNWYNLDPQNDKIQGASVDLAYQELLKDKTARKKIIVAVIDGGVDIEHEDLQGKIWINKDEIPDNGIDDDHNGYIDDLHGWNFIGNAAGENIMYENMEEARIMRKYEPLFKEVKSVDEVAVDQKKAYEIYIHCKTEYEKELKKYQERKKNTDAFEKRVASARNAIQLHLGKESFTQKEVQNITSLNESVLRARHYFLFLYENGYDEDLIPGMKEHYTKYLDHYLNLEFEPRKIIGDDIEDIDDRSYGNNDVKWKRAEHGTFVAGIIAASRNNGLGINGIADNVEIMALRTVPDGDERDKDVALSIIYAVDNGANIINMSFGKNYSPQKQMVDDAIKYAEEQNVLIVHAAGNSAINVDNIERYPTIELDDGTRAKTWIGVGASSKKLNKNFCGIFSNYGQKNVDMFAPGVDLISLYPESKYLVSDGTSFSCPVVSGVAALVWSYYPELSAIELKDILLKSCTSCAKKKVLLPNITSPDRQKVKFSELCATGGIINAYEALKQAEIFVNGE